MPLVPTSSFEFLGRVSNDGASAEAYGVSGILDAYSAAIRDVQLAGPTLFSEVLQTAMARASRPASQMDQRYDVLLILTDGIINDMRQVGAGHRLPPRVNTYHTLPRVYYINQPPAARAGCPFWF